MHVLPIRHWCVLLVSDAATCTYMYVQCSYDAKRPHRGRSHRVELFSVNGVGSPTARAVQWHSVQSITVWARSLRAPNKEWPHTRRAANHIKILTIRALYHDPMHNTPWVITAANSTTNVNATEKQYTMYF